MVKRLINLKNSESCNVVTGNNIIVKLDLGWQIIIGAILTVVLIVAVMLAVECLSRDELPAPGGRQIYVRPAGGRYYINDGGKRVYLPRAVYEGELPNSECKQIN